MDSWETIWRRLHDTGWQLAKKEILRETGISWLVDALHCEHKAYYAVEAETLDAAMEKLEAAVQTGRSIAPGDLGTCMRKRPTECPLYQNGACLARSDQGWEWVHHRPVGCRYRIPRTPSKTSTVRQQ